MRLQLRVIAIVAVLCLCRAFFAPSPAVAQAAVDPDQELFKNVDLLLMNDKTDDALALLNKAIAAGGSATAYTLRCFIYTKTRHYDDAKPDCAKALQLDPKFAFAHKVQGDLFYDSGDLQGSLKEYDTYLGLKPDDAGGYWRRCDARRRLGDWAGAQADCDKAIAGLPNDPSVRVSRGRLELQNKQFDRAYADFDSAVVGLPNEPVPLYWRGYTALQMKKYDQAVADFSAAIKLGDEAPDTYSHRALAYVGLGKKDLAKADWEKAIALDQKYGLCKEALDLSIEEIVNLGSPQTVGLDPTCVIKK
ncbi:MAG TPA: tetratricopeptide repeat protein [Candidatus Rubrimentiphilum sp.]|nr:tetratricopeptide repeat protein [Candidatus Rubrimentiphilum sp.]